MSESGTAVANGEAGAHVRLTTSPTELTTAATDAALAVIAVALLVSLARRPVREEWMKRLWASVFALLAVGGALGAVAHGLDLSSSVRTTLWQPLYLSLGLSVALFCVGSIGAWRGEAAARTALPWAVAVGIGFFALTQVSGTGFGIFIAYEAAAMVATLIIYFSLWMARRSPGAGRVALGVGLTLVAAAIQVSSLSLWILWPFDHNGLFHLVQIVAVFTIASGVRSGLDDTHGVMPSAAGRSVRPEATEPRRRP